MHSLVWITLLSLASALPSSEVDYSRFDRHSPFSPIILESNFKVKLGKLNFKKATTIPPPAQRPFQFFFACSDASPEVCSQARAGFERVGNLISSSLRITSTINVQAVFRSFCNDASNGTLQPPSGNSAPSTQANANSSCGLANTLGQAASAAYFAGRKDANGDWAFYPQALIKQLNYDVQLQFNQFDILAEFNSDFNFYFRTSNRPIQQGETDFEFIVAHELTHGLGFDTGWSSYFSVYSGLTTDASYLSPLLYASGNSIDNAIVQNIEPLNIWDTFVKSNLNDRSFMENGRAITAFANAGKSLRQYIQDFEKSGRPYQAAQQVFATVVSGPRAIRFEPSSGPTLQLNTKRGSYQPGSSIAHVDYDTYFQSPDFLMIPAVQNLTGQTLDQIIAQNTRNQGLPNGGVYGPGLIAMMHAIGWPISSDPEPQTIFINPNPAAIRNSATAKKGSSFMLFLVVFVSFLV